jgi:hypothetical protein
LTPTGADADEQTAERAKHRPCAGVNAPRLALVGSGFDPIRRGGYLERGWRVSGMHAQTD